MAFGLGCALVMIGLRSMLDLWAATAGPFALVYPTVLIATLYGHALAGIMAYFTSFIWAWYYVLAPERSFQFEIATDPSRVIINAASALVVLVLAESFRAAVASGIAERDAEIDRREMMQQELVHRTKNNFALAASLLELQRNRESDSAAAAALGQAISRIHSFASAYANLAERQGEGAAVAMHEYLFEVVSRVTHGAFHDEVAVDVQADDCILPREVAVAIGLFTNEALTNCAKYAFPDGRAGRVSVRFVHDGTQWHLSVADDGVGNAETKDGSSGLGERLLEAFARQAGAQCEVETSDGGRILRLSSSQC